MIAAIPEGYHDLLERPIVVTLVTLMPDNQPQATPVWFSYKDEHIWVNSAKGRQKDKNMRARPQVTILILDPKNPYRYMEVRGVVQEINEAQGLDHINHLSERYNNNPDYYSRQPDLRDKEQRVVYKIKPERVIAHG